jgi:hypothetical protein
MFKEIGYAKQQERGYQADEGVKHIKSCLIPIRGLSTIRSVEMG